MRSLAQTSPCVHCGNALVAGSSSAFCCRGCETVHRLLQSRGLAQTFERLRAGRILPAPSAIPEPGTIVDDYSWLEDPEVDRLYRRVSSDGNSAQFYLEGVHCAACVWLTEKLVDFVPGVTRSVLDLANGLATVSLTSSTSLADVARELARLGYKPHPLRLDEDPITERVADRTSLIRLGVAATCAGNIMLLAVALYAGAAEGMGQVFRWASFALSLPVVLYSAVPFYRGAWSSIRARRISIDLPIALGTVLAEIASLANLLRGSPHLYFDSLTSLVFLLLASRIVLGRAQSAAVARTKLAHFLMPTSVRRRVGKSQDFEIVPLQRITRGDVLEVRSGETIPVDGRIIEGSSELDMALLTGESAPRAAACGDTVTAGTVNRVSPIRIQVEAQGASTRLGQILSQVEQSLASRASIVTYSDRVARIFVAATLAATALIFISGFFWSWEEALSRGLALAIVTCPCAFALATPLAISSSLGRLAKAGIIVKGADVLERLSRVREVFFDKTGTLTTGNLVVAECDADLGAQAALYALEARSGHPIARAVIQHWGARLGTPASVTDFREVAGQGISGVIEGVHYEILRSTEAGTGARERGLTRIQIRRHGAKVGTVSFVDELRDDAREGLHEFQALGIPAWMVSGDSASPTLAAAEALGLKSDHVLFETSPEDKGRALSSRSHALMVGDGANDALALSQASVSVAMHSGIEVALRAADVAQLKPGILPLARLITVSRETMKVIRRAFAFSIAYNALGATAAVLGWVGPLFAAVLMPLSALTVFAISIAGTRKLREALA